MIKFLSRHKYIIAILLLSAILRFWHLGDNPPHLSSDEAALGYNAYSILKTGRDEHGAFMPLVFESFGDWKPGLYIYLTVPFVWLFSLNELSTRAVGALSGVLAVYLIYLVCKQLFKDYKWNKIVGIITSFFLAISPWHLQFTRGAWESGLALTLVLAGVYFFLKGLNGHLKSLYYSIISFSLTSWAYQGAKFSTVIVLLGLVLVYQKNIRNLSKKVILKCLFLGIIICLPILISLIQGKAGRLEVYSIFSYPRPAGIIEEITNQETKQNALTYSLYHSEPLNFLRGILGRWANHYSSRFLFFEGDWTNKRHSLPDMGEILFIDIIFLILGLIFAAKYGFSRPFLFVWFLLLFTPLPAALSRDSVHAVRAFYLVIPITILLTLGLYYFFQIVSLRRKLKFILFPTIILLYLFNFIYYLDQYWIHAPYLNSKEWQYGYKQTVEKVAVLKQNYSEIIMKQEYSQPYIFFLFYDRVDPATYQAMSESVYVRSKFGDVGLVSGVDGVTFRDLNWSADRAMVGKLFIVDPIHVPVSDSSDVNEFKIIDQIKYLNGHTAFRFVEPITKIK